MAIPIPLSALLNFSERTIFNRACIGGPIIGALLGIRAIPDHWVKEIDKTEHLSDLGGRFANKKIKLAKRREV